MPKSPEFRRSFRGCAAALLLPAPSAWRSTCCTWPAPLYMLQVYDRVIPSSSEITLLMLTFALVMACWRWRGSMPCARGCSRAPVFALIIMAAARDERDYRAARIWAERAASCCATSIPSASSSPARGIHAIFDLPWAPIYIAVIFVLHPLLGASRWLLRCCCFDGAAQRTPDPPAAAEANEAAARNYSFTEMSVRNSEIVRAMGMTAGLAAPLGARPHRHAEPPGRRQRPRRDGAEPSSASCGSHAVG